jgi:predicted nucleotidyltransferase
MRFAGLNAGLLASGGRIAVISALLRSPARAWTGSALAREAGVTPRWAIETLRMLEAEGVVRAEWTPPSFRWTLNREHVLTELLTRLASLEDEARAALEGSLRELVRPLRPEAAFWFGSTAAGNGAPGSDVDLLVVVGEARRKAAMQESLARAGGPFYARFGNRLAPVVVTRREFERKRAHGFIGQAVSTGVRVWG